MGSYKDFESIFDNASKTYNVDKSLLLAVAKTESNFNPNATSGVGAKGIMQLMDGTAKELGVTNSYDAEQNIMGGAKYISQLLSKFDGDTDKALASYFAGSGNVNKYGASKYSYYYEKVYKNQKEFTHLSTNSSASGSLIQLDNKDDDKNIIHSILTVIVLVLVLLLGVYAIYTSISSISGKESKLAEGVKTAVKIKQGKVKEVVKEGASKVVNKGKKVIKESGVQNNE